MSGLSDAAVARLKAAATAAGPPGGRYQLLEEIGRGGMGVVYRARDEELGREVAIRIPHQGREADFERRLRIEARVLARLEHPGIVPIHDAGRLDDGRLFYVMKRVRGRTLRDHLQEVGDRAERLRIFERICEPVAFAHAHGCIHRDLKPENIMIGAFGEVMVMDWGVAHVAGEETGAGAVVAEPGQHGTLPGTVVGTVGFMAPEQARGGSAAADARADVYSLGAILYLLLTGAAPGGESDPAAAIERAAGVPRPLRSICARALAPRPEDRYASVLALSADIARFRSGAAVEAHAETILDRVMRFARTYRAAILLILAYLLMRIIVAISVGK